MPDKLIINAIYTPDDVKIVSPDNQPIDVNNPLCIDGDSVYTKDIWIDESDINNFSGSVLDLFDNLHTIISDTTANNPKELFIHFNRTVVSNAIGLGSTGGGNFSNVNIDIYTSGPTIINVIDESADNTKYTTRTFQLPITAGFNAIKFSFHTTDIVSISNCVILKTVGVIARLQAAKPNNTITDINATAGGNLKMSLEELENVISVNSNSQLRTTLYDEDGIPASVDNSTESLQTVSYEHHEIHDNSHYFIEDFVTLGNAAVLDFCIATANDPKWMHLTFNYDSTLLLTLDVYELADFAADGTLVIPRANNRAKSPSGQHTPVGASATVMTDSTAAFTVDALIGWKIYNYTDGSYGIVTDNDATTITVAALIGGTDNDWDQNDYYEINQSLDTIESGCTIAAVGMRLGGSKGGSGTNPSSGVPGGSLRDNEWILRPDTKYLFRFTSGAAGNVLKFNAEYYRHEDKN